MHRFFLNSIEELCAQREILLGGDEYHHAARVLRLRPGEAVMLCADGLERPGTVEAQREGCFVVHPQCPPAPCPAEPTVQVTLYPALIKADKLDWVMQKAVELGACAVQPLCTERCVVKVDAKSAASKVQRFQRIALEAAKQCGRARKVRVLPPIPLQELLRQRQDRWLLAYENQREGGVSAALAGLGSEAHVGMIVGPEGGFAPEEVAALCADERVWPVTLGKRILRAETASVALLTLAMHCLGEL